MQLLPYIFWAHYLRGNKHFSLADRIVVHPNTPVGWKCVFMRTNAYIYCPLKLPFFLSDSNIAIVSENVPCIDLTSFPKISQFQ